MVRIVWTLVPDCATLRFRLRNPWTQTAQKVLPKLPVQSVTRAPVRTGRAPIARTLEVNTRVTAVICHTLEVNTWGAAPKEVTFEVGAMVSPVMCHTIEVDTLGHCPKTGHFGARYHGLTGHVSHFGGQHRERYLKRGHFGGVHRDACGREAQIGGPARALS